MQTLNIDIYFKDTLKDSIVDMLLENGYDDFFYTPCAKYASTSLLQSAVEQVSGRQEYGLFTMFAHDDREVQIIIDKLLQAFQGQNIKILTRFVTLYT